MKNKSILMSCISAFGKKKKLNLKGEKVMKSNPFLNPEGYADPTAYHGMKEAIKEEKLMEAKVSDIVHVIKVICSLAGFEVIGRIKFRHKKSGRVFE